MPTNRSWQLTGFGLDNLRLTEAPAPEPGPHDLLVRLGASSLNYKDKLTIEGALIPNLAFPYVPTSDAAGEVVSVGPAVTRFRPGDRVVGHVITDWIDGDPPPVPHTRSLAISLPGMLCDYAVLHEDAAVATPAGLSDIEAATLPIAALTAWFALAEAAKPVPGQTVLIQGTGGVSLFALQFAAAFGMRAIVTSSSADKLARARELGAWRTINYRTHPDWQDEARAATGGYGVDHVLEMVGGDNVRRSLAALGPQGRVSLIGILGDLTFTAPAMPFLLNRVSIQGIGIGHRRSFERMNRAIETAGIRPVVDRAYAFEEAPKAFAHLARGPFGKVVVGR